MSDEEVTVRCTTGGHEWFGVAAADAMKALGRCIRCGAPVEFPRGDPGGLDDPFEGLGPETKPHQVLGKPRI